MEWVRKILESGDSTAIKRVKSTVLEDMSKNGDCCMKNGQSLLSATASTFSHNELQLQKNKSDILLQFKKELLLSFMELHDMSIYYDISDIKNGDSIVLKSHNIQLAYDVIESGRHNLLLRSCLIMNGKNRVDTKTIKVDKRNFVFGIRTNKTVSTTNHKLFFFFCNNI